jgi:hypothetical protein
LSVRSAMVSMLALNSNIFLSTLSDLFFRSPLSTLYPDMADSTAAAITTVIKLPAKIIDPQIAILEKRFVRAIASKSFPPLISTSGVPRSTVHTPEPVWIGSE